MKVAHPAARRPVLFALVQYALCYHTRDTVKLVKQCAKMVCVMENPEHASVIEAHRLCRWAPTSNTNCSKRGWSLEGCALRS